MDSAREGKFVYINKCSRCCNSKTLYTGFTSDGCIPNGFGHRKCEDLYELGLFVHGKLYFGKREYYTEDKEVIWGEPNRLGVKIAHIDDLKVTYYG